MVCSEEKRGLTSSGPLLCEKASQFSERLHGDSLHPVFKASNGWLWHFCKCHGPENVTSSEKGLVPLLVDSTVCTCRCNINYCLKHGSKSTNDLISWCTNGGLPP